MPESAWFSTIREALKGLRYGTIQLTVHEGKLVRIERVERIRLPHPLEDDPTGVTGGKSDWNR